MGAEEADPEPMQLLRNVEGPPLEGEEALNGSERKKVVVVGLGMVGIAFIEKLMKLDAKRREYDILVFGEEPFLAYNRVGLTSYFQHRKAEELYLNAEEWYENMPENSLRYYRNTRITEIDKEKNLVKTDKGSTVPYDVLVLATGSDAILPKRTPGHDAKGVFVYRTIDDIQRLIDFAAARKGTNGAVVGGGLLGLEAAKAMLDLEEFGSVKLVERNRWVMSRQLDYDAGSMLVEQVRAMGLDVMLQRRVAQINVDDDNCVKSITFEDGDEMECSCVCFAIGVSPRDELAKAIGLNIAEHGGVSVDNHLRTNVDNIYAIGECASWDNATFGLIAPGIEMADVLAFNLTQAEAHAMRDFKRPDVSTKLKLLGCDVASFGDYFADRDGPKYMPGRRGSRRRSVADDEPKVKALTYKDPFQQVYKKYLFTKDGQYLLGGMMIGDTSDYVRLLPLVNEQKKLEVPPGELIVGQKGDDDGSDLPDSAQICSCHNVSKGGVKDVIKDGTCTSIGDVKSCTKAGTGCGGCMPLVQTIFNQAMADMGQEVKNHLCPHFEYSRADLFNIVYVRELDNFAEIMKQVGKDANSTGCEACKPAIGSILASLYNKNVMDTSRRGLQDTNDRFLANVQRNGTFSVIPRVSGGEITPDKLIVIGSVAKKYGLYTKITGGQRIDMFGAKKQNLLDIWQELIEGGMESGHAYAKSLRTVKSCVGTSWCRFGIGDSVGMAVRLEERYKSIRSPHKLKGGVSGCVRECAEAQSKDFGLIATDKGYNIFVGGNGGATPRHAELLAKDVPPDDVVPILDRYLAFYIRCADKLQRTARWIENLPNGITYLKEVILEDKLGICDELEKQMIDLVGTFFCEWTETLNDPARRKAFRQFANTDEAVEGIEMVDDRGQPRPAYWAKESAYDDFRGKKWSSLTWQPIVEAEKFVDTPTGSSLPVKRGDTQLAIFKVRGKYYCSQQMCPHRRAFALSDGLIGDDGEAANSENGNDCGKLWISCPMHKRNYLLKGDDAGKCSNDENFSVATFDVEERDDGWVYVKLPPVAELDELLGTQKWRVMAKETKDPFESMDIKLNNMKGMKGRKVGKTNGPNGTNGVQAAKAPPEEREKADRIIEGKDSLSKDGAREPDAINGLDF